MPAGRRAVEGTARGPLAEELAAVAVASVKSTNVVIEVPEP
jgi:hypothetical protein